MIATLASADPNVAHALRSHFNFTEAVIHSPDSPEKRDYVSKILDGKLFAGAHTEVGAPLGTILTRLTRTGDDYRLNGKNGTPPVRPMQTTCHFPRPTMRAS